MPALYITFVVVCLAGLGARDQIDVAGVVERHGPRRAVLLIAVVCACLTAAVAAWASTFMLALLPPPARSWFVIIALALAGAESLLLVPKPAPREPTHSLGALALTLLAHQVTDAARFLVLGIAAGFAAPVPAAVGGAIGGSLGVAAGWALPQRALGRGARVARRLVGAALLLAALVLAMRERGIL